MAYEDQMGWKVEHIDGRQYGILCTLDYDATDVTMFAESRTTGKPPSSGWQPKRDGEPIEIVWRHQAKAVHPGEQITADFVPLWEAAPLPNIVGIDWNDAFGKRRQARLRVPLPRTARPDLRSPLPPGFATRASQLATRAAKETDSVSTRQYGGSVTDVDPREVFVVVGRNTETNKSMFSFLRAINLKPIEWSMAIAATGSGSPYIGDALEAAFARAQAVVVFMTPDDVAQLRPEYASGPDDPELTPSPQARPNVLFEAGMALGLHPNRTILVELGSLRSFSDVAGRHAVRLDNSAPKRSELANRLKNAGCDVDTSGSDWYEAGDFTAPKAYSGPAAGRRLPSNTKKRKNLLDANFLRRGGSNSDRIQLINRGSVDLFELTSPNVKDLRGVIRGFPVARLPAGKSVSLMTLLVSGSPDTFELVVTGRTEDGDEIRETLFLDLNK